MPPQQSTESVQVEPPKGHSVQLRFAGVEVSLETGRIARQATASVIARRGDDLVLATVVAAPKPREGVDFLPLTVEYREKFASAGRIPGSFQRREGRISDREVLVSRLIDRTLRSLFPKGYHHELQVQVQVLSADPESDLASLGLLGATAAMRLAPVPFQGPAAGVRIVRKEGEWVAMPVGRQQEDTDLDFIVSAGPDGVVMVEGEAAEASEADCAAAIAEAGRWLATIQKGIDDLRGMVGVTDVPPPELPALPDVPEDISAQLMEALGIPGKQERHDACDAVRAEWLATLPEDADMDAHKQAFGKAKTGLVRERILSGQGRLDGRGPADIRPIWCQAGFLPRAHGSAVFTRGETQAIVSCTLASTDEAQRVDGLKGLQDERFLLHYNFPPYSVGEIRPLRGPGRREIGHGNLARRGLASVFPDVADWPYTVRIEADITESNGSSSMATVCGGCLAMLDAGVTLRTPVAGIAMGLIHDGQRTAVLSDILGDEDHLGDMDFKVIGTAAGVTALQLDNKIAGIQESTLLEALEQAKAGRLHILAAMAETRDTPNKEGSEFAPRVHKTAILPSAIGALIGPRGQNIQGITQRTGAKVTVEDDGRVLVYATTRHAADSALAAVNRCAGILKKGKCYRGTVTGVREFGVFVKINEINEGLVPAEELDKGRVDPGKIAKEGDEMVVEVLGADPKGRLRLSRKNAIGVTDAQIEF